MGTARRERRATLDSLAGVSGSAPDSKPAVGLLRTARRTDSCHHPRRRWWIRSQSLLLSRGSSVAVVGSTHGPRGALHGVADREHERTRSWSRTNSGSTHRRNARWTHPRLRVEGDPGLRRVSAFRSVPSIHDRCDVDRHVSHPQRRDARGGSVDEHRSHLGLSRSRSTRSSRRHRTRRRHVRRRDRNGSGGGAANQPGSQGCVSLHERERHRLRQR